MTGNSGRKHAQRAYPTKECARCGGTETLQRHHRDRDPTNNEPENVEILCAKCHGAEHRRLRPVRCSICGEEFQPKRARRATVCGPECLRELGRQSANKRWSRVSRSA